MSEVFYYNYKNELQKIELYNSSSSEFVKRNIKSGLKFLCVIEDGEIIAASPEFAIIEEEIADSLVGILC
jgi:hypothetical protein